MTRAKLDQIIPMREELKNLKGKIIIAKDIADGLGITPQHAGILLSTYFQDGVEHIGYERVGQNIRGRKRYQVCNYI